MPRILAAAHALPAHSVPQEAVKDLAGRLFAREMTDRPGLLTIFDNSRIRRRQFMMPLPWYAERHTPVERNRIYHDQGLELLVDASRRCLAAAAIPPDNIDQIIFVSSTGHATPTLDTFLINRLGLRNSTTRLPLWGLGCAGGAAGLSRAHDHCLAFPEHRVLLVALECCSLTFMADDLSKKNLVGTSLFADGAAAVLVVGDRVAASGPEIIATRSHLFADSHRLMGWDFLDEGMKLVLSPKLPLFVRQQLLPLVENFLGEHGIASQGLVHYITHPGGARVVDAYRDALGLTNGELALTEEVLRDHGNVSSVSVLLVLEKWLLLQAQQRVAGHGLLSAFGPGFSAELLLVKV